MLDSCDQEGDQWTKRDFQTCAVSLLGSVIIFDPARIEAEISDLEEEMASPGFWEDRERATEASRNLECNRSILSRYRALTEDVEEVEVLHQMAEEMADEEELKALLPRLSSLENKVRTLRIELTFSDPYDLADCYLSINAGAGGTDSQDWAEMLLRMYGRYCEHADYKTSLLDVSSGDEAGIRSATLEIKGRYAYGNLKGEKGVHRLVRISPFDSAHRRHTSFTAVSIVPVTEEQELERHVPLLRCWWATRQRHRFCCADHSPADEDSSLLSERTEPTTEQGDGDAGPACPPGRALARAGG